MTRIITRLARLDIAISLVLAAVLSFATLTAAHAATPAETFVQVNVQKGLTILNNKTIPAQQKSAQFRTFLLALTDLRRIALYTLGPSRRTATPAEQDQFIDAFREFAFAVYETEFQKYSGQTLKVTGSIQRSNGDYIVTTVLIDPNAPKNQEPIEVDFRVIGTEGHFLVADITVAGLDLAITEQDQFTSYLAQHGNDVKSLIADLKSRAQKVRATGQL
ncbi:MAG TPA: ABC transporter substrate-binding protein [Rhizomicrobium sp.]|jgi:phospholipid transport system substrate-binding protein|nr:ABC transporter substrate-binding protein [Rhizomicrobium sp.]